MGKPDALSFVCLVVQLGLTVATWLLGFTALAQWGMSDRSLSSRPLGSAHDCSSGVRCTILQLEVTALYSFKLCYECVLPRLFSLCVTPPSCHDDRVFLIHHFHG